ncbi:MAG: MBL fold metallo-hydrolase [Acidobacteriota bacterium]
MNQKKICTACGTQFPNLEQAPECCPICSDDRQYLPESGQTWTTLDDLSKNFKVMTQNLTDNLYEMKMTPHFAIGQRALLIVAPGGNILWDCIPLLDEPTIDFINSKGGLKAIAFSHPHFYSTMGDWAEVFNCTIYIHQSDDQWIVQKTNRINLWSGMELKLWDNIKIINIGGHFPGSCILHVPFLSAEGVIMCGDSFVISPSKKHIAVMHSYPNKIPLPLNEINRIKERMRPLQFDTLYAWNSSQNICSEAKLLLEDSLARYV